MHYFLSWKEDTSAEGTLIRQLGNFITATIGRYLIVVFRIYMEGVWIAWVGN